MALGMYERKSDLVGPAGDEARGPEAWTWLLPLVLRVGNKRYN